MMNTSDKELKYYTIMNLDECGIHFVLKKKKKYEGI